MAASAELRHPLLGKLSNGTPALLLISWTTPTSSLLLRLRNGRHQHLLGAIASALFDFLQEAQVRIVRLSSPSS